MKKNIDIKAILREALRAAEKQHGLVVEVKKPELEEAYERKKIERIFGPVPLDGKDKEVLRAVGINREFDIVKDMPSIDLSSEIMKGDPISEAGSVEPLFAKIRGGETNPRKVLERLSQILGIGTTGGELSTIGREFSTEEIGDTGLFAAVLLYKSLHDIVRENEAQSAGRIWEVFFTRLLGANSQHMGGTETIVDVKGGDNTLYSLKLVNEETQITGSKAFLVDIIRKGKKLVYIIGTKSEPTNVGGVKGKPFYLKFRSFIVDETNYMFLLGNKTESDLYGDQKGSEVFINQFATVWDNLTKSGKIQYDFGKPATTTYHNINKYRPIFKKWMETPEILDLSKLDIEDAAKYAPPKKVEVTSESTKRFNLSKQEWDQDFIGKFASGEVPYSGLADYAKGKAGVDPEVQALMPVFDQYQNLVKTIEDMNEFEKDPKKAMSIQEFFLLYSAMFSARFNRNKVGRVPEDSMYSSIINGITTSAEIGRLVNAIKKDPTMSKEKISANLDSLIKMQELPEQGKFKASLLGPATSEDTNIPMVLKRIITFQDDTQSSSSNLNNQMRALRTALATRFENIASDSSLSKEDRNAAKIASDAVNSFVFNKYENIKSESARRIYQAILGVRKAYTEWLEKMRSKKAIDAKTQREKNRIPSGAGADRRQISLAKFLELVNIYSVEEQDNAGQLQEAEAPDQFQSPEAKAGAESAKEEAARAKESGNFAFDQSKLAGQADFLYLNRDLGPDGKPGEQVEWPTIVLDPKMVFYNAERSKEALMSYIAPIFEAAFYLNAGAVGYFGKDIDQGLLLAQKSVKYLQENLGKQSEPQQNIKENLKRDELDDMIDELFK